MPKIPTKLYDANPRAILKSRKESVEVEKQKKLAAREARRKKEMGKTLVMLTKWKKEMGDIMNGVDYPSVDQPQTPLLASVDAGTSLSWQMNSSATLNDDSLVTEYTETDPPPMSTPSPDRKTKSNQNRSSSSSPPQQQPPSDYELLKWKAEATLFVSQAETYLSPEKPRVDEEEKEDLETPKQKKKVAFSRRQTTIEGEPNEFATPAINPNTTELVERNLSNFQSLSFNTTAMALDKSVMSEDKLEDYILFQKKTMLQKKLMSPKMVTGEKETILVREKYHSPVRAKTPNGDDGAKRSQIPNVPQLYKMSWPVIPNAYEMEKFQKENENLKKRMLVARGKLSPRVLKEPDAPPPYPLGETPLNPRSGGIVEPGFYGVKRNENPVRIPNSHYSFWQQHSKMAPKTVEMGLGIMSFELPDVDLEATPDKNSGELKIERDRKYFGNVDNYIRAQNGGFLDEEEASDADARSRNPRTPVARQETGITMSTAKTNSPFAMSKVPSPERKAELFGEAAETLNDVLNSNIGKGLYHDTTSSVLAAPIGAHTIVPQIQPFGFSPDKPRLRILSITDALKYQGELSPRTKLHHFQMFPYSTEAHEAAFIIQRFWGRHINKRNWAVTLVQCYFRKMRAMRDFQQYITMLRRARKTIGMGARKWLKRVHLTRDSEIGTAMVFEDLAKQLAEQWFEEERIEQFWKNAMLSLLYRYRWKRRMKKRRKRRKELEEVCAVRMQRGARYFMVTRMMKRWNDSHIVIKRSFRAYFFRAYKKQLRRIMNCWRSYWLRHHVKLIQRIHRGRLARKCAKIMRKKLTTVESLRGAREVDALNTMLRDVKVEMDKHLTTKGGVKELRARSKLVRKLRKESAKNGKAEATKDWGGKFALKLRAWLAIFEVVENDEGVKGDGFVDINSLKIAMGDLLLGERELLQEEELEDMIDVLDNFKVGHLNCDLVTGYLRKFVEERRAERRAGMGFVKRVRTDVKCFGKGLKIAGTNGAYIKAARHSLLEQERKRFFVKTIEAYRESGESGAKPRVVCQGCLRPFPFWTMAAQRHIASGGCCLRPSFFLPMEEGGTINADEGIKEN